jgi:hypothetical protein
LAAGVLTTLADDLMTKIDEERGRKPMTMEAKRRAYVDLGRWMEMAAQTQEAIHALVGAKGQ